MLALTHAHPDHQGVAKDVCEARGVPLACHADDVEAMEDKRPMQEAAAANPVNRVIRAIWQGPPYKVDRVLREWAYAAVYGSSPDRAALSGWIERYNFRRRHGALGHRPPIARLRKLNGNNVAGIYT